jgi:flavin-dependent dehydrogenase
VSAAVDVVVVGGGPAGVAAALGCARRGLEVALLDKARFPRDKPCGEGLLPAAVFALEELGLFGLVRPHAVPIDGISFAVPDGPTASSRFCDASGRPAHGLGIGRRTLDALLIEAARAEPAITVLEGVEARGPLREGAKVTGVESSAGTIRARCVMAADGLRSTLREQLGLDLPARAPRRVGLRVHFRVPQLPFGRMVRVIVARSFEYYLTPVGVSELQVAVLGDQRAFHRHDLGAATMIDHLRVALGAILDDAEPLDRPLGAGPFRQRARRLFVDGAILVGDAAGYFDAITGEGIGLALETGRAAAHAVANAIADGEVTARALQPYAAAHARIVRDTDRLTRLVLWLARSPLLARRAVACLARRPSVFTELLQVQAGAPLSTVPWSDWARLVAG